jgi:hypothetical protein
VPSSSPESRLKAAPTIGGLLRQGAQTEGRGTRRTLDLLVVAQVALVLGVAAALMLRSVWTLQHVSPGFVAKMC